MATFDQKVAKLFFSEVDMDNFRILLKLRVKEDQKRFVGSAEWILALAYADKKNYTIGRSHDQDYNCGREYGAAPLV